MKNSPLELIHKYTWLVKRVKGSKVLHVGCTDWPLTADRLAKHELLHPLLCNSASHCVGIDLDREGIEGLRKLMPSNEFHTVNAETLGESAEFSETSWDYIIAGDVVEHMNNPGLFFQSAHKLLKSEGTLIVTVPSAYSVKRFFWLLITGVEHVHPDHTAYFSESTLTLIGQRNGFKISKIYGFQWENSSMKNRISKILAAPLIWLSSGRLADELAVEYNKI